MSLAFLVVSSVGYRMSVPARSCVAGFPCCVVCRIPDVSPSALLCRWLFLVVLSVIAGIIVVVVGGFFNVHVKRPPTTLASKSQTGSQLLHSHQWTRLYIGT